MVDRLPRRLRNSDLAVSIDFNLSASRSGSSGGFGTFGDFGLNMLPIFYLLARKRIRLRLRKAKMLY
jgi:hypothetical protein